MHRVHTGYYLKNGECFACSNAVPNCRTCAPASGILTTHEVTCTSCTITYYLNTSYNTCELLIPHCAYFFKEESSVQCQMCLEGYHLVIDSQGNSACTYVTSERTEAWLHIWVTITLFFWSYGLDFPANLLQKLSNCKEILSSLRYLR